MSCARVVARPILFVVLLASAVAQAQEAGSAISWRTSYEAAAQEAAAARKRLWIEFTGPWCVYCHRMERETFSRPEVAAALREGFVPVRVRSDEREDLVVRYQIVSLPAVVVLDVDLSQIVLKHEGYLDTGSFVAMMRRVQPEPELGLGGYDPVFLVQTGKLAAGLPEIQQDYDGGRYRFRDTATRDAFLQEPERYVPTGRGDCPISRVEGSQPRPGDPRFGVYYKDHLYLCSSEAARAKFAAAPESYAQADVAGQGLCPHCQGLALSPPARGLPQFSAIYRGLRYLFPNEEHRQAFRAAPDRYVR